VRPHHGGDGAYFTTSQLLAEYATADRGFSPTAGGLLAALIGLAGIPGSIVGGMMADRSRNIRVFLGVVTAVFAVIGLAGHATAVDEGTPSGIASDPVERTA
jgi:predicted MFS family arabinose efflux permease